MQRILGVATVLLVAAVAASTTVVTPTKGEITELEGRMEVVRRAARGDLIMCAGDTGVETLLVVRYEDGYSTLVPPHDLAETRTLDLRTLAHICRGGVEVFSPHQYPAYQDMLVSFVRNGQT